MRDVTPEASRLALLHFSTLMGADFAPLHVSFSCRFRPVLNRRMRYMHQVDTCANRYSGRSLVYLPLAVIVSVLQGRLIQERVRGKMVDWGSPELGGRETHWPS